MTGGQQDTRYFVVRVGEKPLPHAVIRVTGGVEEAFTDELRWGPADLLGQAEREPRWTVAEIDATAATELRVLMLRMVRTVPDEPELAEFEYHAVFRHNGSTADLDDADMLIRRPRPYHEELYVGGNRWVDTDKLERLWRGDDWLDDSIVIQPAQADYLRQRTDERWAGQWRHFLLTENGRPFAVVRTTEQPNVRDPELACTGGKFTPSNLLSQATGPRWQVTELDWASSVEHVGRLIQQVRSEYTGGYAVFRRLADVPDLESAYAVVAEPGSAHQVTVRLRSWETEELRARVRIRTAKRTAEPVDGYYYFAEFRAENEVLDLGKARSALRRPVRPSQRPARPSFRRGWEELLRDGTWLGVRGPDCKHLLPIGGADLALITRQLTASG